MGTAQINTNGDDIESVIYVIIAYQVLIAADVL